MSNFQCLIGMLAVSPEYFSVFNYVVTVLLPGHSLRSIEMLQVQNRPSNHFLPSLFATAASCWISLQFCSSQKALTSLPAYRRNHVPRSTILCTRTHSWWISVCFPPGALGHVGEIQFHCFQNATFIISAPCVRPPNAIRELLVKMDLDGDGRVARLCLLLD